MDTTTETEALSARERWERAESTLAAAAARLKDRDGIDYHHDTYETLSRKCEAGNHRAVREVMGLPRTVPAPELDSLTDEQRAKAGERAVELMREGAARTISDFGFCSSGVSGFLDAIGQPPLQRKTMWRTTVSIGTVFVEPWNREDDSASEHSKALQSRIDAELEGIRAKLAEVDPHLADVQLSVSAYPDAVYG